MKNFLLLIFLLILSFSSCSQTFEKEGLLWKISGKDITQPSYLFGTYHGTFGVGADFLDNIPGFYNAFDSITQFVGEIDPVINANVINGYFTKYFGIQFLPTDTTYKDFLNENDYQFLDSIAHVWGRTNLGKIPFRPNYLWLLIIQGEQKKMLQQISGITEKEVMDSYLLKKAQEKKYLKRIRFT